MNWSTYAFITAMYTTLFENVFLFIELLLLSLLEKNHLRHLLLLNKLDLFGIR